MNLQTAVLQGTKLLDEAHVASPRLTAELLLCHALGRERIYLYSHSDEELTELAWIHYGRYLHERIEGKPAQYITRRQEFYGRGFHVSPDVLIPRPETELVVESALPLIPSNGAVLDVGCGSGAIAVTIALERPDARVFATDISAKALAVARKNADRLGARVQFVRADVLTAMANQSIDVIVSNPPYVGEEERSGLQREVLHHEPHVALFAGPTGNEIYHHLMKDAVRVLRPAGHIVLELGWRSLSAVSGMVPRQWTVKSQPDLAGIPRVLIASAP